MRPRISAMACGALWITSCAHCGRISTTFVDGVSALTYLLAADLPSTTPPCARKMVTSVVTAGPDVRGAVWAWSMAHAPRVQRGLAPRKLTLRVARERDAHARGLVGKVSGEHGLDDDFGERAREMRLVHCGRTQSSRASERSSNPRQRHGAPTTVGHWRQHATHARR